MKTVMLWVLFGVTLLFGAVIMYQGSVIDNQRTTIQMLVDGCTTWEN